MITDGIPILWIIINLVDLQFPLVIYFAIVQLDLENDTSFAFICEMVIINPIIIVKFFHILCDTVFMSLFTASQLKGGLLGPISNYFATVNTNGHDTLYLHYLV